MNTTTKKLRAQLAAALNESQTVQKYLPESNPLSHLSLADLRHGQGVATFDAQYPALNMTAKSDSEIALGIERERREGLDEGRADKSAKRMVASRARAARKAQIDALAAAPIIPSPQRLTAAWLVVTPMSEIVQKIAHSKRKWAERFLGSNVDDVASMAIEKMVLVLAKDVRDLGVLQQAANELAGVVQRTGQLPGDQVSDAERTERRQLAKARKWLMGMANNRVMGALVDTYTDQRNLRWENIDLIATVMASINGAGQDPLTTHFKASKAPSMVGATFQRPGSFDPAWLATAISAAITEHRLDPLTELLLDEANRRSDGAFKWNDNAEAVFLADPERGIWRWDLVSRATEHLADARHARGQAARIHVQQSFQWLPSMIVEAVEAFDYRATEHVEYIDGVLRALVSSTFEEFAKPGNGKRFPLRPALTFSTVEKAARVLAEHIGDLVSNDEIVASLAHS